MARFLILIVDDSPTVLSIFGDLLESPDHLIRTAANGADALRQIEQQPPDLMLLDVMMPGMDGYEVCRTVRAQPGAYLPILMITAPGDLELSLAAGADDFISKPPDPTELHARVNSLLRIRTLQKTLYEKNTQMQEQNTQLVAQNQQLEAMSGQLMAQNQQLREMATQLQVLNQELELLSVTDGLTTAYNHRHFQERLGSEFARAKRHGEPLSCVMVDVDHFKQVNDRHGHLAGDEALVRLVEIFKEEVRREDVVARYGGEEFALLLPKTTAAAAQQLTERLRTRVEAETLEMGDGRLLRVTISMGVAEYLSAGPVATPGELIELADRALFRAKELGRNRVETAEAGLPP